MRLAQGYAQAMDFADEGVSRRCAWARSVLPR
jgi:hypothetical protein